MKEYKLTMEDLVEIQTNLPLTVEQAFRVPLPHEVALDEKVRRPAPHERLPHNFTSEAWQRRYGARKPR